MSAGYRIIRAGGARQAMFTLAAARSWLLSAHLVGMVGWLGGLIVLLRVMRLKATEPPSARATLARLEARLNWGMVIPSAILSTAAGVLLVRHYGLAWLRVSLWMHVKLALVLVLLFVHLGVTRAQRRISRLDHNAPLSRAPFGLLSYVVGALLVAIAVLAIHRPMVGGS